MPRIQFDALVANHAKLYESRQHGPAAAKNMVEEFFRDDGVKGAAPDFGRLFEACFGSGAFRDCRDRGELAHNVMEAYGAVSSNAFQTISGQIVFSMVMDAYNAEELVFAKLIETKQTPFNGELIPGITEVGDEALEVGEGEDFPLVGVTETHLRSPTTKKRGMMLAVTREAVFFDRTGVLLQRCSDLGKWMAVNREKRAIDCVIDENAGAAAALAGGHRYHWRDNSIATYGDNSGTHSWDNLAASNALVDWTDIDNAEQVFNAITDPDTGEPVTLDPTHLVVTKQLEQTARRILSATEIRVATPGYATTGNPTQTNVANPYLNKYQLLTSRLLASRLATDTDWFLVNFKAFRYMENWPMQVKQAPANNLDEFKRDIVQQYRVDERGAYTTIEPRLAQKNTA